LLRPSSSGKGVHQHITDKDDDWGIARDEDGRLQVAPDNHRMGRSYIPNLPLPVSPSSSSNRSGGSDFSSSSSSSISPSNAGSTSVKSAQKSLQLLPSSDPGSPYYGVVRTGDEEDDADADDADDDGEDMEITFERKVVIRPPHPASPNPRHEATTAAAATVMQTPTAAGGDRSDSVASDGWQRYRTPSGTTIATDSVANSLSNHPTTLFTPTETRSRAADVLADEESEILKELESAIFHHH
jgi:hypothetical protein